MKEKTVNRDVIEESGLCDWNVRRFETNSKSGPLSDITGFSRQHTVLSALTVNGIANLI
jgi:hypothetical protein